MALANRNTKELLALGAHYGLAALAVPLTAFVPAVLLSGLISATIVTVRDGTCHNEKRLFVQCEIKLFSVL